MTKQVEVELLGRDRVRAIFTFTGPSEFSPLTGLEFSGSGCRPFLEALNQFKRRIFLLPESNRVIQGEPAFDREIPTANDHSSILIRELVMKARGVFELPFQGEELCHCRAVPTSVVDRAIVGGCHTVQSVARMTSAGTSCGTCKPDTESLIAYRLAGK